MAGLIAFAIYDIFRTTVARSQEVQESTLKGQLADFLLSTREPDGTSLLDNPADFSRARRPLKIVSLSQPFFGYFLNRQNARSFSVDAVAWEAPRSCLTEFGDSASDIVTSLQGCFATVSKDPAGRYVYFILRYPTAAIRRHTAGDLPAASDHIVLSFSAAGRVSTVNLVFETPMLAATRYPSQLSRFQRVHEVSAFVPDERGSSSRLVSAQAIEQAVETKEGASRNVVTVMGRIHPSAIPNSGQDFLTADSLRSVGIGLAIYAFDDTKGKPKLAFSSSASTEGTAMASIERAYLAAVPSRASLTVNLAQRPNGVPIWRSEEGDSPGIPRRAGRIQQISDWWAATYLSFMDDDPRPVTVTQRHRVAGQPEYLATLTAQPGALPDVATRAFVWLTCAFVGVLMLGAMWFYARRRLANITSTAYRMTTTWRAGDELRSYAKRQDEIGVLGRVLHLLITRSHARSLHAMKRMREDEAQRREAVYLAQEQLKSRQAILDAIGHEIRSPLQSLLNRTTDQPEVQAGLERMRRAVDALLFARSVEDGLKSGSVVLQEGDLAAYLRQLAHNLSDQGRGVQFVGPEMLPATFDPIALTQVLENVVDNAERYRSPLTVIELRLRQDDRHVVIEACNEGPHIDDARLEDIFKYGVSDNSTSANHGLGLFAARSYVVAMLGTIRAENRSDGVAMVITLPLAPKTE